MTKKELIRRLHEFHAQNGLDIGLLFEEEPELYRAALSRETCLLTDPVGADFLRLVTKVNASARRDEAYKASFDRAQQASKGKDATSLGFIPGDGDDD